MTVPALPRALPASATIGICAPSGWIADPAALARSVHTLEARGHQVRLMPGCLERDGYCAGTAARRLADLHALVHDPAIDLVLAARGGFGLSHLLAHIDWAACANSGKLFCGFSDFTAFHAGLYARTGQISIAGPMATSDLATEVPDPVHDRVFWPVLQQGAAGHTYPDWSSDQPVPDGEWQGTLWGGNLCLLAHLCGTPYLPAIDQGILFLEDIGEAPYRIERMLLQLDLAGVLARQQVILLGAFTACEPPAGAIADYRLKAVIAALRMRFAGPVLTGLPFGHVRTKWTLPFGAQAQLRVEGAQAHLRVLPFLQGR